MARADVQKLYRKLMTTAFSFVAPGKHHIQDVYKAVKRRYLTLCDDSFLCADNCSSDHQQPEWQHVVRKALQAQRSSTGPVTHRDCRGQYMGIDS